MSALYITRAQFETLDNRAQTELLSVYQPSGVWQYIVCHSLQTLLTRETQGDLMRVLEEGPGGAGEATPPPAQPPTEPPVRAPASGFASAPRADGVRRRLILNPEDTDSEEEELAAAHYTTEQINAANYAAMALASNDLERPKLLQNARGLLELNGMRNSAVGHRLQSAILPAS
jgi:hypothetical protein